MHKQYIQQAALNNRVRNRIPLNIRPAAAAEAVEPRFSLNAFGVVEHKGTVKIAGFCAFNLVRRNCHFAVDEFLSRPFPTMRTWNLNTHPNLQNFAADFHRFPCLFRENPR